MDPVEERGGGGAFPGTPFVGTGTAGSGPAGGQPGIDSGLVGGAFTDPVGGGGGGGNATAGSAGGLRNAGGPSASGAGGPAVVPCRGGSGGGGGGGDIDDAVIATNNDGGGGGGGGGGDVVILSNASITINGALRANGGAGGTSTGNGGGGGGGAGGAIEIQAPTVTINGLVQAIGGSGGLATQTNCGCSAGGAGGDGCIVIGGVSITAGGTLTPPPTTTSLSLILTPAAQAGSLLVTANGPTSSYVAVAALNLAGAPIVLPQGTFYLDLADPLLNLLFPVNTVPFIFSGLTGTGAGVVGINVFPLGLPLYFDLTLWAQGASLTGGGLINGITPLVPVHIRF